MTARARSVEWIDDMLIQSRMELAATSVACQGLIVNVGYTQIWDRWAIRRRARARARSRRNQAGRRPRRHGRARGR